MIERRSNLIVAGAVAVLAAPYLIAGPNFHGDDWVFLRNARFDGALYAAGGRQVGRPGAVAAYDLTFGVLGAHPLLIQFVQVLLWLAVALALCATLQRFVPAGPAFAVSMVWLVVPTHSALEHWSSTVQVLVALLLLVLGIRSLAVATDEGAAGWPAAVMLAAAVATYEITVAAAAVALVAVPLVRARNVRWDILVRGAVAIAVPLAWRATHRTVYAVPTGHLDATVALSSLLALGLTPVSTAGRIVTVVALVGTLVAGLRLVRVTESRSRDFERLTVAGLLIVIVGIAPLARFATNLFGMDDRLTVVSGVGAAMIWVGIAGIAARNVNQRLVIATAVIALTAVVVPLRIGRTRDYVDSGRAAVTEANRLAERGRQQVVVDVPGPLAVSGRIAGLYDGWNATAATQLVLGREDVIVRVSINGTPVGPRTAAEAIAAH